MTALTWRSTWLAATLAVIVSAPPLSAQQAAPDPIADPHWAPWLGCWQLLTETVQDPESLADAIAALGRSRANAGALVCVTPSIDNGVRMTTLVNEVPVLTETIVADGTRRSLSEPDCRGWQRAEWSTLGPRLFAQAEIACANQPTRTVSGLALMMAGPHWIDVQVIESEGRKSLRVRRYVRAANQKPAATASSAVRQSAAMPLGLRLSIADVIEANAKAAPEALQAALVEIKRGFDLNGDRLIELDRAGVPDSIVDLMVALSFPKHFVVERRTSGGGGGGGYWGAGGFESMWPYYADPYFYTSYYAPFGYRYWGRYDPYYFQGPGFVIVDPSPTPISPSGAGRVVDGRGYTRVRRNEPEPINGRASNGGAWSTASGDSSGSSRSGSDSGVSSSGYSSGGSSGGSERTAQPRPPGSR
jgi:hypothetical protein